ncbi:GNAT family N-acetyltransferase [Parageobacillus sp. KH3-4]|uniref:GNAT family N-acetyltransferase n=1 Tax=Parageobacillus sp. KH3-4 TaxID=2916802 RepID=UPI001FCAC0CE|nr:GNAT family N-acetyltransferase [Parageobacillus sp. KH3-4]
MAGNERCVRIRWLDKTYRRSHPAGISSKQYHCACFFDGRIVGFGRALSDGVFNAAIYDVVVHRDFQKRGIGKAIVEDLLAQLRHVSCVHLIATTGNEPFYQQAGFKKIKTAMGRYLSRDLAREYLEGGENA